MNFIPKILLVEGGYECGIYRVDQISPPLMERVLTSARPMPRDELLEVLRGLGFPERDVLDALASADGKSIDPNSEQGLLVRKARAMLGHPET